MDSREIELILRSIPNKKVPGPDKIPNEALKLAAPLIAPSIASLAESCFDVGFIPTSFCTSTTIVLRKDDKDDYSLPKSYRPIALLNTLAKVLEKLIAERLTSTLEENSLLPPTQFGACKCRSVTTAISFISELARAAWHADPRNVVSILSLDLVGAFDNVSHD